MSNGIARNISLNVVGQVRDYATELAKLEGITAAAANKAAVKLLAPLTKAQIKAGEAAEKAAGEAARAWEKAGDSMPDKPLGNLGAAADAAGGKLRKLRGVAGLVSDDAAVLVGVADDLADGLEVVAAGGATAQSVLAGLASIVLPLAVAVAAAATAWIVVTNATTDAASEARDLQLQQATLAERTKISAERAVELAEAWEGFTEIASDVQTELDVINGKLTENQARAEKQVKATEAAARSSLLAEGQRVGALKTSLAANEAVSRSEEHSAEERAKASGRLAGLRTELERATASLNEHKRQVDETAEGIRQISEVKDAEAESDEFLREREEGVKAAREAQREAAEHAKDAEEELRREREAAIAALDAETARTIDYASALERIRTTAEEAAEGELDAIARVGRARDDAQDKLLADYQDAAVAAQFNADQQKEAWQAYEEARVAISEGAETEIAALREQAAEDQRERLEKLREEEIAAAQEIMASVGDVAGMVADGFGKIASEQADNVSRLESQYVEMEAHLTDAQKKEFRDRIESQKAAAQRSFEIVKTAKIAEAIIATASAVVNALDDAPYPANLVLAAISAGAGAAQIATISAQQPSFADTPQVMQMERGGSVRFAPGDLFAAARNPEDLRDQVGAGPVRVVSVTQYRHQTFNPFIRDGLDMGNPITDRLNAGKKVGHRERD